MTSRFCYVVVWERPNGPWIGFGVSGVFTSMAQADIAKAAIELDEERSGGRVRKNVTNVNNWDIDVRVEIHNVDVMPTIDAPLEAFL